MQKKKKILFICLASLAAVLIFIVAILPLIVRSQAVSALEKETGRKAHINKVFINPFGMTVTISGFALEAKEGGPFVSISQLRASLSSASLYKFAVVLDEVSVDSPSIRFERLADNTYSFSDIIELQKAKPKKESKQELRFSVNNITLNNGTIDFNDKAVGGGREHTVRNLKVAIPFISNIPYLMEKYTDPHLSALVNNAPFSFSGKVKPLSRSMETSVHIDLKELKLPAYMAYSPVKPLAKLASGRLTVNADLTYRISKDLKPELGVKGAFRLDDILINMKDDHPLLKLPSLQVNASNLEVFARRFLFDSVTIEGLELFASRNAKGDWMYDQLLPPQVPPEKKPEKDAAGKDAKSNTQKSMVQIASFRLSDGIMHFSDAVPTGGYKSTATQIDAVVTNFSTEKDKSADYDMSFLLDQETTFRADGRFSLDPLTATVNTELSDLELKSRWPYMARWLTAPLKGTVDLSCRTTFTRDEGLTVSEGAFLARGLSTSYGSKEGIDLKRFELNGIAYSQKKNFLEADEIRLSRGDITLSREVDGSISLLSLLKKNQTVAVSNDNRSLPAMAVAKAAAAGDKEKGSSGARDFSFSFKKILLDKLTAAFTDKTFEDKPHFKLSNTTLSMSNLNGPKFTPAALRFSSTFNKATPIKASGFITPAPFRYKGSVNIGRLPLYSGGHRRYQHER